MEDNLEDSFEFTSEPAEKEAGIGEAVQEEAEKPAEEQAFCMVLWEWLEWLVGWQTTS